ncbi:peptide-methionine (S)-S-oxide reductase MsrA [Sphingomonas sp. KRR8]|uniref:peptide-methionine (S)-S-oxide reductase MsrA n=1 Tax=Sphingomonas sp. KRR8 TaxID=2942996 RepID=UPI00202117DD|nr:peptide-methionine (S)-S-oxide reductase MsrA [Sphingomonas sp. KRR8]URD59934.1 peptide-methionine (S)-S-oxide reductase MsrA [Sphingomonas sp. KRR8]
MSHRVIGLALAALLASAPASAAPAQRATAVLAGGCFWGLEGVYEHVKGVIDVTSGYAGGSAADANYPAVSSERTRHAEAVRITYDPTKISYGQLLQIFASVAHDPTQLNRQGPDEGTSYRSAIFPQNAAQAAAARAFLSSLAKSGTYKQPIVTRIENGGFYPAEAYHQNFMRKNPYYPYIVINDRPKVAELKRRFPQLYHD